MEPGNIFGEQALKKDAKRGVSVYAYSKIVELIEIHRDLLLQAFKGTDIGDIVHQRKREFARENSSVLSAIPDSVWEKNSLKFETRRLRIGEILRNKGDKVNDGFIVLEGLLLYGDSWNKSNGYFEGMFVNDAVYLGASNVYTEDLYAKINSFISVIPKKMIFENIEQARRIKSRQSFRRFSTIQTKNQFQKDYELLMKGTVGLLDCVTFYLRDSEFNYFEMKALSNEKISFYDANTFLENEAEVYRRMKGKSGYIPFIESFPIGDKGHARVYQFIEGVRLSEYIGDGTLEIIEITEIAAAALDFLRDLHNENIIYRNMRPESIIITFDRKILFHDLELAKPLSSSNLLTSSLTGDPLYWSPSFFSPEGYSISSDFWSLGILLFTLLTGCYPQIPLPCSAQLYPHSCMTKDTFPLRSLISLLLSDAEVGRPRDYAGWKELELFRGGPWGQCPQSWKNIESWAANGKLRAKTLSEVRGEALSSEAVFGNWEAVA